MLTLFLCCAKPRVLGQAYFYAARRQNDCSAVCRILPYRFCFRVCLLRAVYAFSRAVCRSLLPAAHPLTTGKRLPAVIKRFPAQRLAAHFKRLSHLCENYSRRRSAAYLGFFCAPRMCSHKIRGARCRIALSRVFYVLFFLSSSKSATLARSASSSALSFSVSSEPSASAACFSFFSSRMTFTKI